MSPTSYHCSTPHSLIPLRKSGAKVRTFFKPTKYFCLFFCYSLIIRCLYTLVGVRTVIVYVPAGSVFSDILASRPTILFCIFMRPQASIMVSSASPLSGMERVMLSCVGLGETTMAPLSTTEMPTVSSGTMAVVSCQMA